MLGYVVKQGSEHWQQGTGCVADVLGYTLNLREHKTNTQKSRYQLIRKVNMQKQCSRVLSLTWFRLDTLPSFRFSTIFSMSSAALSKNWRRTALTISGPDFITVLENKDTKKVKKKDIYNLRWFVSIFCLLGVVLRMQYTQILKLPGIQWSWEDVQTVYHCTCIRSWKQHSKDLFC